MSRRTMHESFHVRPRYTPGSPALVSMGLAARVGDEERSAFRIVRAGAEGPENAQRAKTLGLHLIAYTLYETKSGVEVTDLLTGERYRRESKYSEGDEVEVWSDERGWVRHIVSKKYSGAAPTLVLREPREERWQEHQVEVRRDLVRSKQSVKLLEAEELQQEYGFNISERHIPSAVVSGCDGDEDCGIEGCPGCEKCDGGWLVMFCCAEHGKRSQSVCGSRVECPPEGGAYARVSGPTEFHDIATDLRRDGVNVTEGS